MQNSLWKLGALLGVIGAGFLVLLKAQSEMGSKQAAPDEFSEQAAIEELESLGESTDGKPAASSPMTATYSESEPSRSAENTANDEPAPTLAQAESSGIAGSDSNRSTQPSATAENPFASFASVGGESTPSKDEEAGQAGSEPGQTRSAEDDQDNPFTKLLQASGVGDDPAEASSQPTLESASDGTGETEDPNQSVPEAAIAAADALIGAVAEFDPFAQETGDESQQADAPTESSSGAPEEEPTDSIPDERDPLPTLAAAADAASKNPDEGEPEESEDVASEFEPTSLAALPPVGVDSELQGAPLTFPGDDLPVQNEPSADSPAELTEEQDTDAEIVQVSGEQRPHDSTEPNPFLVFPGDDDSSGPAPAGPAVPATSEEPAVEPRGSTGRAWIGDLTPNVEQKTAPSQTDETLEMTIKPRNQREQPVPAQDAGQGFNPFGASEPTGRPAPRRRAEPGPFDIAEDRQATRTPQADSDNALAFPAGPIQPSSATGTRPTVESSGSLTPADFIGVGTISPETPSTPQQAQLTIEKQAPSDAALGQELIYSIVVRNVGQATAKNVVVEDLVPKGSELQGTDPQAQMTAEKKLVWQLGSMAPSASRTIRIKVIPTEAGQIGSVATVSFEAAVASRTIITAPQLQLTMDGPREVRVGEKAPYRFTVSNSGTADATNVYIRSIIPAGFEHPAARQENGVTDLEYEVGRLARGETKEVELTLLAVAPGQFEKHAIITADGNVNVEQNRPVDVITSRLEIHREGPANRVVGSEARFTNTVTNRSQQALNGITVTESLPEGLRFVRASDGGTFDTRRRLVTWQLPTLEPGSSRRLQTIVLAEESGRLESNVAAVDQRGDEAQAVSSLNVTGFSSLTVDVANPARAIPVGDEVALRLKVRNGGTAAARGVETRIQLPPQLRFVSARGPVRYAQEGEWIAFEPIDRIEVEGEQTFEVVLAAAEATQDARVVVQLESQELTRPLSEDESVVIYAD